MATLADVTTKWQTQAKDGLDKAKKGAEDAKDAADKAAIALKAAQDAVADQVTKESSLLASLDDAPSPADLEQRKSELIDVRRDLRQKRSALAAATRDADVAARAAVRAQAAVAAAGYGIAVATGAAKDADGLKNQVEKLTKATTEEPVKSVHDRAGVVKSDELDKALQHIVDQIGPDLLKLAQAQAKAVRAETHAALERLDGARRAHAIVGDESDPHAALLATIDALGRYAGSSVAQLDTAVARLRAIAGSAKASQEAIDALDEAVDSVRATRLADERSAAAKLTDAEAKRTVVEWRHEALLIATPDSAAVATAKTELDTATDERDDAAKDHDAKKKLVTAEDETHRKAWNDAVPITLWPLLADLMEASATVNELANLDPAALIAAVTTADAKAADDVDARLERSKKVQALGIDMHIRADDVAVTEASQSARLAAALSA
jgi:hypothetical protein